MGYIESFENVNLENNLFVITKKGKVVYNRPLQIPPKWNLMILG